LAYKRKEGAKLFGGGGFTLYSIRILVTADIMINMSRRSGYVHSVKTKLKHKSLIFVVSYKSKERSKN
jgi:hypothetical protein